MKRILYLMIVLCTIPILTSCTFSTNANNAQYDTQKAGEVMVYTVKMSTFEDFVKEPQLSILIDGSVKTCLYTKSITQNGYIDFVWEKEGQTQKDTGASGTIRLGSLPVYTEFIDFVSSTNAIQEYLKNNEIDAKVNRSVLIEYITPSAVNIPITLWAQTDNEDYLITVESDIYNPRSTNFIYTPYTKQDYYDKYGIKDGTLKVNGKDITEGNYIKFQNNGVYLPFRAVMENLGAKIDWDADRNAVLLTCNGKEYVLETNNGLSLVEVGTSMNLLMPPPGGSYSSQIIDGRTIMDNYTMQAIVKLMGAKVEVNYDELIVNINQ